MRKMTSVVKGSIIAVVIVLMAMPMRNEANGEKPALSATKPQDSSSPALNNLLSKLKVRYETYGSYLTMAVEIPATWEPKPNTKEYYWKTGTPVWSCFARYKGTFRKEAIELKEPTSLPSKNSTAFALIWYTDGKLCKTWCGSDNSGIVSSVPSAPSSPFTLSLASFMTRFDKFPIQDLISDSMAAGKKVTLNNVQYRDHPCIRVVIPHPEANSIQHVYFLATDMDYYPIRWQMEAQPIGKEKIIVVRNETLKYEKQGNLFVPKLAVRYEWYKDGVWTKAKFYYCFHFETAAFKSPEELAISYPANVTIDDRVGGLVRGSPETSGAFVPIDQLPTLFKARGYNLEILIDKYQEALQNIPQSNTM